MAERDVEKGDEVTRLREELDVTARKLADAHKMASLGRLAAGVVHEINTPIGSIFSNNEVLLRGLDKTRKMLVEARDAGSPPPATALETLDVITGLAQVDKIACERISGVIRSLKTFARVSEHDLLKADINDMLRTTMKLAGTLYRRRIEMVAELEDLPEVECFPGLLNQVFLNLIVNAAQAIQGEGRIMVRSRREGAMVHVAIEDTGPGIPEHVKPRIFAPGFSTKPIGEGSGLGLSISREIVVDTHGGEIDFESEPDQGTTFHVRIPIEQKQRSESRWQTAQTGEDRRS